MFNATFDLSNLNGDYAGVSVASAGDINGDGRDDVMLGALGVDVFSGQVCVVFGQSSFTSPFSLSTLDGSNGFIIKSAVDSDYLGSSIASAGDINKDGIGGY